MILGTILKLWFSLRKVRGKALYSYKTEQATSKECGFLRARFFVITSLIAVPSVTRWAQAHCRILRWDDSVVAEEKRFGNNIERWMTFEIPWRTNCWSRGPVNWIEHPWACSSLALVCCISMAANLCAELLSSVLNITMSSNLLRNSGWNVPCM